MVQELDLKNVSLSIQRNVPVILCTVIITDTILLGFVHARKLVMHTILHACSASEDTPQCTKLITGYWLAGWLGAHRA